MKSSKSLILLVPAIIILVSVVGYAFVDDYPVCTDKPMDKLFAARSITVREKRFSFGKHYDLIVNKEIVATVKGKSWKTFGDIFTLAASDGKVIAREEEQKGFFQWNRAAICYDGSGKVTGHIGEESFDSLFSPLSYVFHFYDADKKEVGRSEKHGNMAWSNHKLKDLAGNVDYDVDREATFVDGDTYVVTIVDYESGISLPHALLLVCIEDAIADAHTAKD